MKITSFEEFATALQNGPYAWPGGYPLYFITEEGYPLSFAGAAAAYERIKYGMHCDAYPVPANIVVGIEINWEDDSLFCCETGSQIEAAYID